MKKKMINFFVCIIALIVGLGGGLFANIYLTLPDTESLILGEELFYSYNDHKLEKVKLTGASGELSIHFLELGNKYTGDCTYIKVGDVDVLIDCGSRTSSISAVSNYINQYITDKLDYVVVTHAHRDHYAGFATSENVKGIFDLYEVGTIIDFGNATGQADGSTTYENYKNKLNKEKLAGAKHYSAYQCFYELDTEYGKAPREFVLDAENDVTLEILYNYYYQYDKTNPEATAQFKAETENDYSVCVMLNQGDNKHFLFTGDLEKDGEKEMVDYYKNTASSPLPEVDLYKAGHHGSGTSSSEGLLAMIKPKNVCVCCCAGSPEYTSTAENQFPTQAFISRIAAYTQNVYVTTMCVNWKNDEFVSMNGNVVFIALPTKATLGLDCSNNDTILKDTDWFNAPMLDKDGNIIYKDDGSIKPNRYWPEYNLDFE